MFNSWLAGKKQIFSSFSFPHSSHLILPAQTHTHTQIFNNMVKERGDAANSFLSSLSSFPSPIFLQLRNADCYTALLQRTVRVQMKYNGGKFSVHRSGDSDSLASALDSASPKPPTTTTAAAKWQAFVMSVSVLSFPSVSPVLLGDNFNSREALSSLSSFSSSFLLSFLLPFLFFQPSCPF